MNCVSLLIVQDAKHHADQLSDNLTIQQAGSLEKFTLTYVKSVQVILIRLKRGSPELYR